MPPHIGSLHPTLCVTNYPGVQEVRMRQTTSFPVPKDNQLPIGVDTYIYLIFLWRQILWDRDSKWNIECSLLWTPNLIT
jgi:hypothetical protein